MLLLRWVLLAALSAVLIAGCGGSGSDEPVKTPAPAKAADAAQARNLQEVLDGQRKGYNGTGMAAAPFVSSGADPYPVAEPLADAALER